MRVQFLGVRGSTPAVGPEFVRYGGNTSCVALGAIGGPPTLVLDAGTGIRSLAGLLNDASFSGSVLLSHLHWDHVEGLPFSGALDRDDARTDLLVPRQLDGTSAYDALASMMSPPNFPIDPNGLRGQWTFSAIDEGVRQIDGFEVTSREVAHKGGRTFGYRISDGNSTIAYLPDHCPTTYGPGPEGWGDYPTGVLDLVSDVDLLIHDALLTVPELPAGAAFGHAAAAYAVSLGTRARAASVVLFHHSPTRTDDMLDDLAAGFRTGAAPAIIAAAEGSVFNL
jgi:phosphoribosyl 1,2-cyclic phosphodiesterase